MKKLPTGQKPARKGIGWFDKPENICYSTNISMAFYADFTWRGSFPV